MYTIIGVAGNWIPPSASRGSRQPLHTLPYGATKSFLLSSLAARFAWFWRLEFNSVAFQWALAQLPGRDLESEAVSLGEQFLEFSPNIPAAQEIPDEPKRQTVVHAVLQKADAWALGWEKMRVLPLAERAGKLDIAERAALEVVAVLENPADAKRAKAHKQDAAVAIADPRSVLLDSNVLPWRRQFLERARLGVSPEKIFGGGLYLRAGDKSIFSGHPSQESPPPSQSCRIFCKFPWRGMVCRPRSRTHFKADCAGAGVTAPKGRWSVGSAAEPSSDRLRPRSLAR
jgi:hypothetical protein